ncbi:hypothetical protein AB9P05_15545 [Roseivirga sp. BDSF3-8]|uniref:hypothetical protein n=1 Tax=Roseivirga sp. BDSF3-8 TaxID=3241598 RepID=UPI003531F259
MKKEKLSIVSLKVESFITNTSKVRGGAELPGDPNETTDVFGTCGYFTTEPKTCQDTVNWCWTP